MQLQNATDASTSAASQCHEATHKRHSSTSLDDAIHALQKRHSSISLEEGYHAPHKRRSHSSICHMHSPPPKSQWPLVRAMWNMLHETCSIHSLKESEAVDPVLERRPSRASISKAIEAQPVLGTSSS